MCACINQACVGITVFLSGFVVRIIWLAVGFIGRVGFWCCWRSYPFTLSGIMLFTGLSWSRRCLYARRFSRRLPALVSTAFLSCQRVFICLRWSVWAKTRGWCGSSGIYCLGSIAGTKSGYLGTAVMYISELRVTFCEQDKWWNEWAWDSCLRTCEIIFWIFYFWWIKLYSLLYC